jgi:hypothetical protein
VCGGVLVGGERVKEGDYGDGIWQMDFIYLYEIKLRNSCNCFKWVGRGRGRNDGGKVNNVHCKSNQNYQYESIHV